MSGLRTLKSLLILRVLFIWTAPNEPVSQWMCRSPMLNLYCDERRDIQWNIAWVHRLYFIKYPDSSQNTDILNYNSSNWPSWRSILEELILRIAPTAGQYGKILPSRLSNTGDLNFNIIMFSIWEWNIMWEVLHWKLCIYIQCTIDSQLDPNLQKILKIVWNMTFIIYTVDVDT